MKNTLIQGLQRAAPLPLRLTPKTWQKTVLERVCQQAFAPALNEGALDFLQHRWLEIHLSDAHWRLYVSVAQRRLQFSFSETADGSIRGDTWAFIKLVLQQADPDTLFFHRELSITGDTAMCLNVKNVLDQLDPDQLPTPLKKMISGLRLSGVDRFIFGAS